MKPRPSLRPRKLPVQARSIGMVDVICEATLRVLLKHGYSRMTTTRVADVAGISVGSLYQYFPNKRALVAEVMRRFLDEIVERVDAAIHANRDASAEVLVARTIEAFIDAKRRRPDVSVALRAPLVDVEGQTLVRKSMSAVAKSFSQAISRSAAIPEAQAIGITGVILAAVEGAVSTAVDTSPDLLQSAEFRESVVGLGLGYLMWLESRRRDARRVATRSPRRSPPGPSPSRRSDASGSGPSTGR